MIHHRRCRFRVRDLSAFRIGWFTHVLERKKENLKGEGKNLILYSLIKGEKEIWEMEERPPHSHLFFSSPFYQRGQEEEINVQSSSLSWVGLLSKKEREKSCPSFLTALERHHHHPSLLLWGGSSQKGETCNEVSFLPWNGEGKTLSLSLQAIKRLLFPIQLVFRMVEGPPFGERTNQNRTKRAKERKEKVYYGKDLLSLAATGMKKEP